MNKNREARSKARLKWFLDFIYLDIDYLSRADFLKLLVDVGSIIYDPYLTQLGTGKFPFADTPYMRQEIKEHQSYLKQILDGILGSGAMPHEIATTGKSLRDLAQIREFFKDVQGKVRGSIAMTHKILQVKDRVFLVPASNRVALLTQFMASLSPFSLNDIKQCEREDCGRDFFRATKKEKRYCSNKCAWVVGSRKRREANAKKEREKKRLSYERRKKRELGPNIKIQARKRKEG